MISTSSFWFYESNGNLRFPVMIVKQKTDIKLFLVQLGAALAVSFAGFLFSRVRSKRVKPSLPPLYLPSSDHGSEKEAESSGGGGAKPGDGPDTSASGDVPIHSVDNSVLSPNSRQSGDMKDGFLLLESNDVVKTSDMPWCRDVEMPWSDSFSIQEKVDLEKEIRQLRNTVRMLQEREKNLEIQLIEYYGLKEQQTAMMELQNRLKLNQMETKLFNLKIDSLQAENKRLNAQVADHAKAVAELEAARSQIKTLKKKLRTEAQQNKEQILSLQQRVARLQEQELQASTTDGDILVMQRLKDLEAEIDELKKSNTRLQSENSELAQRLESTQILANSRLEDPEIEAVNQERNRMTRENEDLKQEIEQLQADRVTDLEELVYLRWINACLRYELRNYQAPPGKQVARDLSKTLSPQSEQKAKKLILEYAQKEGFNDKGISVMDFDYDRWSISSQGSYATDSGDLDDSSFDASSASKTNNSGKRSLLGKLRKLIHGKDAHHHGNHCSSSERAASLEAWDPLGCSSSIAVHSTTEPQNTGFAGPRPNYRHSLDFQMLMHNRGDEYKDAESSSHQKSDMGHLVDRSPVLDRQVYTDLQMDQNSESAGKSELIKFAGALKNSHFPNRLHKKSASYTFGDT